MMFRKSGRRSAWIRIGPQPIKRNCKIPVMVLAVSKLGAATPTKAPTAESEKDASGTIRKKKKFNVR